MWAVTVQTDALRGGWIESAGCYIWLEHHYLVARQGDEVYLHFYKFNDWDEANRLAKIVRSTKSFSPENKTGIWTQYADSKPFGPKRKNMTSAAWRKWVQKADDRLKERASNVRPQPERRNGSSLVQGTDLRRTGESGEGYDSLRQEPAAV